MSPLIQENFTLVVSKKNAKQLQQKQPNQQQQLMSAACLPPLTPLHVQKESPVVDLSENAFPTLTVYSSAPSSVATSSCPRSKKGRSKTRHCANLHPALCNNSYDANYDYYFYNSKCWTVTASPKKKSHNDTDFSLFAEQWF